MDKFKAGDRVRVISGLLKGQTGTVTGRHDSAYDTMLVDIDHPAFGAGGHKFYTQDLCLISEASSLELDLSGIEARAAKATGGPWTVEGMDSGHSRYEMNLWVSAGEGDVVCDMDGLGRSYNEELATDSGQADAAFIAHAREDIPALVAEVRKLRKQVARLEGVIEWTRGHFGDWVANEIEEELQGGNGNGE